MPASAAPDRTRICLEISPRSIVWALTALVGVWLFLELRPVALLLLVALVFAGTFNPLVAWIEGRGLKRVPALAVLFVSLVIGTSLLIFLTVPALLEQLAQIVGDAPRHREQLIVLLQRHGATAPLARAVQNTGVPQASARIENALLGYWPNVLRGLGWAMSTLFLTFYLLADGKRTQGALYAVVPRTYHMRLASILRNLEVIVGGYMRGQLLTSAAIGVFTLGLLLLCRVPNALPLAVFAAVTDVIPFVGGVLATAPAVLSALSRGPAIALTVLAAMVIYQEIESRVLVPKVYGRVLRLSPSVVILALLSGGVLLGVMGALLALPIAAGLQMIITELRVDLPGDDSEDHVELARDAEAEALYSRLSAGSTAPEAGRIAHDLEQDIHDGDTRIAADEAAGVS